MKLEQYLKQNNMSATDFAKRISVGRMAMHRYLKQGRIPRADVMKRVKEATGGRVTADDFYMAEDDLQAA